MMDDFRATGMSASSSGCVGPSRFSHTAVRESRPFFARAASVDGGSRSQDFDRAIDEECENYDEMINYQDQRDAGADYVGRALGDPEVGEADAAFASRLPFLLVLLFCSPPRFVRKRPPRSDDAMCSIESRGNPGWLEPGNHG